MCQEKCYFFCTIVDNYFGAYKTWKHLQTDSTYLNVHSFRHFYNTQLLANNIQSYKVDAVLGHSDGAHTIQHLYTNFDASAFYDVIEVQKKIYDFICNAE